MPSKKKKDVYAKLNEACYGVRLKAAGGDMRELSYRPLPDGPWLKEKGDDLEALYKVALKKAQEAQKGAQ